MVLELEHLSGTHNKSVSTQGSNFWAHVTHQIMHYHLNYGSCLCNKVISEDCFMVSGAIAIAQDQCTGIGTSIWDLQQDCCNIRDQRLGSHDPQHHAFIRKLGQFTLVRIGYWVSCSHLYQSFLFRNILISFLITNLITSDQIFLIKKNSLLSNKYFPILTILGLLVILFFFRNVLNILLTTHLVIC